MSEVQLVDQNHPMLHHKASGSLPSEYTRQSTLSRSTTRVRSSDLERGFGMHGLGHASLHAGLDAYPPDPRWWDYYPDVARIHAVKMWDRYTRKGKPNIGVLASLKAIMLSSCERHRSIFIATLTEPQH